MSNNTKTIYWVDFAKIVSMMCVVLLHAGAPILWAYKNVPINTWHIANIYGSMVRMCVPVFFMISGYLLLSKKESMNSFYTKRVVKIVIPLIFWSIVYLLWIAHCRNTTVQLKDLVLIIKGPIYAHLWFLYTLIGLYLIIPLLRVFIQNSEPKEKTLFIVLWFFFVAIIPFFQKIFNVGIGIPGSMVTGYIGYLVVGFVIGGLKINKKNVCCCTIVFIISIVITAIGTYKFTTENTKFDVYFYDYLSPSVIIMSASFFVLLKWLGENLTSLQKEVNVKLITMVSTCSFGVYLSHFLFLDLLSIGKFGFKLNALTNNNPLIFIPTTAVAAYILSLLFTIILRKIPFLKHLVP